MKRIFLLAGICAGIFANAQNTIVLQADKGKDIINKNIYGHFAEHLGHCIYGGLFVGENNTRIPNKDGVRLDVIDALKKLKVPVLRWPGGCFADTYHWKDGIGPKKERPSILNVWWGNVKEDNSFGTNEFLNMCEVLGAEPYLSGNVGSGTPQELSDWVKYTTHPNGTSPMTDLRQKNGRANPWQVKYWGLGNEAWGCGGNMKPDYYANIYRQYATFMTSAGKERIYRIASGASDADYNWTETLMREIPHNMLDAVGVHHYSVISWNKKGSATAFDEELYYTTMQRALEMEELVSRHAAVMDKYDPNKRVAIAVDEWGGWYDVEPGTNGAFLYQQNTMRDAMIAGTTLNIFNNHCDRVKMANLAQIVNVLQAVVLTNEEKIVLTPTYHVMEMYNVHQDATMLPVAVTSNDYKMGKEKLKAVSASASKDKNGKTHISLVNIDASKAQDITINIEGASYTSVSGRILSSDKLQNYNSFENPDKIRPAAFNGAKLGDGRLTLSLPPFSVVVLELK
ncbi:alpha-N-arabinofuranosidase [Sediminibacterium soli]|uniref:alpha-N-arabinofuranosidase n=1 Tax=Sediminibacterium soli TaxID=2698829 RepID=UPI00137A9F00|nr:alpha-L-arabinofuranosidase C-terminal domain-containing protein [Sediminibacterium soli]NCI45742.1 alpha-N-arabinofuranosidase [Sediminibacterium soli]